MFGFKPEEDPRKNINVKILKAQTKKTTFLIYN